jgi:hypothetical protein
LWPVISVNNSMTSLGAIVMCPSIHALLFQESRHPCQPIQHICMTLPSSPCSYSQSHWKPTTMWHVSLSPSW